MVLSPSGSFTVSKLVHEKKVWSAIAVTLLGIIIEVKRVPEKADMPMLSRLAGRAMDVIPAELKAYASITLTVSGSGQLVSAVHPENAYAPISVTAPCKTTPDSASQEVNADLGIIVTPWDRDCTRQAGTLVKHGFAQRSQIGRQCHAGKP